MKRSALSTLLLSCLVAMSSCSGEGEPQPQWVVTIATDAPVPHLGDRVLVEILRPDAEGSLVPCDACTRRLAADDPALWPLSFGVQSPDDGTEVWVRARLFRSAELDALGFPTTSIVIDRLAKMPSADGVSDVALELHVACMGQSAELPTRASCDPATGALREQTLEVLDHPEGVIRAGTWGPAQVVDCEGQAPDGMVCHPGGVLILGTTQFVPSSEELNPNPEHLVQLSPFWMDIKEMTVGRLRALLPSGVRPPKTSAFEFCTYTEQSAGGDDYPVNCVALETARAVCASEGKRLPTEAEWEFAATNAGLETMFPIPVPIEDVHTLCDLAVVSVDSLFGEEDTCVGPNDSPGLRPGGSPLDLTALGVQDMTGSLTEWTSDVLRPYSDASCWGTGIELLVDPTCREGDTPHALRGGSWVDRPFFARSATRNRPISDAPAITLGFRCVKDASP